MLKRSIIDKEIEGYSSINGSTETMNNHFTFSIIKVNNKNNTNNKRKERVKMKEYTIPFI